jgi:hypothetical protein
MRRSHVQFLDLQGLSRVADHRVKAVAHKISQLTHLNLEDLFLFTDDADFLDKERNGRKTGQPPQRFYHEDSGGKCVSQDKFWRAHLTELHPKIDAGDASLLMRRIN